MTPSASRRRLRRRAAWAVPVVVAGAVAGTTVLGGSASAGAHPVLPAMGAAELLAGVQTSDTQALSGTVVETVRLGLPELPGSGSSASLDWRSLLTGSHTARVWVDGPDRQRLALVGELAESDVVHSGRDLWTYASDTREVTHAALPEPPAPGAAPAAPEAAPLTPQAAAQQALAAVDPSTAVTVDPTQVVADRSAYTLVLTPRETPAGSTVRRVAIAVDSRTHVPLRVQVFGAGADAAFETGFTDVSFDRPAASVFRFTPPKGSAVTERALGAHAAPDAAPDVAAPDAAPTGAGPTTVGTGWTSVLVLPAGSAPAAGSVLDQLTTTLPSGDRLVRTALVSALLTRDGRVLVGAVTPDLLQQAAGG